jgi:hypothetical protein
MTSGDVMTSHEATTGIGRSHDVPSDDVPGPDASTPCTWAGSPGSTSVVAAAVAAFLVVFLLTGFIEGALYGGGWGGAIASGTALGTVAAGLQLLLIAVRRRREFEDVPES